MNPVGKIGNLKGIKALLCNQIPMPLYDGEKSMFAP